MTESPYTSDDTYAPPQDADPVTWWSEQIVTALAAYGITATVTGVGGNCTALQITASDGSELLVSEVGAHTAPYPPSFTAWSATIYTPSGDGQYTVFLHYPNRGDTPWTAMCTAVIHLTALITALRVGDDTWGRLRPRPSTGSPW